MCALFLGSISGIIIIKISAPFDTSIHRYNVLRTIKAYRWGETAHSQILYNRRNYQLSRFYDTRETLQQLLALISFYCYWRSFFCDDCIRKNSWKNSESCSCWELDAVTFSYTISYKELSQGIYKQNKKVFKHFLK